MARVVSLAIGFNPAGTRCGQIDSSGGCLHLILFYDGSCALCHGFVRWILKRDPDAVFQFAPLQGETFAQLGPSKERVELPDSVAVRDADGRLHTRSDAVIFVLRVLGRPGAASALAIVPRPVRDLSYSIIAKVRYAICGRKKEMCPLVPAEMRSRFLE